MKNTMVKLGDVAYSGLMLLTALGTINFPEVIFNVINGFFLFLSFIAAVLLCVMMVKYPFETGKSLAKKEKEKQRPGFLGYLNVLLNIILALICLVGQSILSETFSVIIILQVVLSLLCRFIKKNFLKSYGRTPLY